MAEETQATSKKTPTVYTEVDMGGGRIAKFPGKSRALKDPQVGADGTLTLQIDFLNGASRSVTIPPTSPVYSKLASHGLSQKVGDSYASAKNIEDAVMAAETTMKRLEDGLWEVESEGGASFAGAHIVVRAVAEARGVDVAKAKAMLEAKLAADKDKGLTRAKLYAAFKNPDSVTGKIIARMEKEEQEKSGAGLNADDLLGSLAEDPTPAEPALV